MLPRTSTTSNQSRLRRERDAVAFADPMASETDVFELPTTSVFTYVWLFVIGRFLLCPEQTTSRRVSVPHRSPASDNKPWLPRRPQSDRYRRAAGDLRPAGSVDPHPPGFELRRKMEGRDAVFTAPTALTQLR